MIEDVDIQFLPYREVSNRVKEVYEEVMRTGNLALLRWYEKSEKFRPRKKYGRMRFFYDILHDVGGEVNRVKMFGVTIPKTDIKKMLDVHNIEANVIEAYSQLARNICFKWAASAVDRSVSLGDLYNEASEALRKSIYYYTRSDVRFCTYVYWSIKRRMINCCNCPNPLSNLPQQAIDLRRRYRKAKIELNRPVTFLEVVDFLGLNQSEVRILQASLVLVFNQDTVGNHQHSYDEESDFSTVCGSVFNGTNGSRCWQVAGRRGFHPVFAPTDNLLLADLETYLEKVDLSDIERKVLDGFLKDASNGWQTRLARTLNNPNTDQPYTRMSVSLAWDRIIRKLKEVAEDD